ncbi:hypothetical protein K466DRAFT_571206, partial [Polyporus arcularius HHB13444]
GRKRAPQGREVFCRLFYDDEHEAAVQEELKGAADDLGRKLTRAETMAISRAHVDLTFKAASDDMKAQVAARVAAEKESLLAASRTDDLDREPTPEEYQAAIDAGPSVFEDMLTPAVKAHGWVFALVGAGPCPEEGGEIRSYAVHFGQNQSGHTLPQVMPDFREKFVKPLIQFAKGVFPREVRDRRALRPVSEDMETNAGPSATQSSTAASSSQLAAVTSALEATIISDSANQPTAALSLLAVPATIPGPLAASSHQNASTSHVPMELDSSATNGDVPMTNISADLTMPDPLAQTAGTSENGMVTDQYDAGLMFSEDMYAGLGPGMGLVGGQLGGQQFGQQFGGQQFPLGGPQFHQFGGQQFHQFSGQQFHQFSGQQFGGQQFGGQQFGGQQFSGQQFGGQQFGGQQFGGQQFSGQQFGGQQFAAVPGTAAFGNMGLGGMLETLHAPLGFDQTDASMSFTS